MSGSTLDLVGTGLIQIRHRVLQVNIGRWLQRDPIDDERSPSCYDLLHSNPSRFVDPMGLTSCYLPGPTSDGGGISNDSVPGSGPLISASDPFFPEPPPMSGDECCRAAANRGYGTSSGERLNGRVICCQGRLVACWFRHHRPASEFEDWYWNHVRRPCVEDHEVGHVRSNTLAPCPSDTKVTPAKYNSTNQGTAEEKRAYREEAECLRNSDCSGAPTTDWGTNGQTACERTREGQAQKLEERANNGDFP
jgi:RHS repeat-associated protein